jgi:hypothetical protein
MGKFIFRITGRGVVFFTLWLAAALFLYGQGNFRHFSDENLLMILHVASIVAAPLLFTLAVFLISGITAAVTKQCKVWPRILLALPGAVIAIIALYVPQIIEILVDGILPWEF